MRIITQPTIEPVTLADIKEQIGIQTTETGQDALIIRRITEARQWAESYMQRALIAQTQEIRLDEFPSVGPYAVVLPYPNLISVVSVKYIDTNGTEQTVLATDYTVDTYTGTVRPIYGTSWPSTRDDPGAVRIQYLCGYGVSALAAAKTITAATNATPGVFTSAAHGFIDGDIIEIQTTGMTVPDGLPYRVYAKDTNTFQLANLSNNAGLSTVSWGTFATGTAQKVETNIPVLIKEAMLLLVGHWMNFQPQSENGASISRVPWAIRDILDKYSMATPS